MSIFPLRASSDRSTDSQTRTCCCHYSVAREPYSSCRNHRLAIEGEDLGDGGHSSTHQLPLMREEWSPSLDVTGSGFGQTPPETGTKGSTASLNTASVMPSGISLCGKRLMMTKQMRRVRYFLYF